MFPSNLSFMRPLRRCHASGCGLCGLAHALVGIAMSLAAPGEVLSQQNGACSGPTPGAPASVVGVVLDASAGVVTGASVTIECGPTRKTAKTGGDGRFQIEMPPGSYELRIDKDGFARETELITLAAGARVDHRATLEVAGGVDSITVTAGGFEQLLREAPASVSIVSSEELQTRRISDLAQALTDVEGVDTGQDVGKTGGVSISMRGMPSDYTLMLIDGKRQNVAGNVTPNGFGETATSFMPPVGAIDRIEVVRGPMSTLYGSDAMGGVVNVITRRVGERWTGSLTVDGTLQTNREYGDTGKGSAYLAGPVIANRLGLALWGSALRREPASLKYENVNGQAVPITSFGLSPTQADIQNAGTRVNYQLNPTNDISFDYDGMFQQYDNSNRQLGTLGIQGGYQDRLRFNRQQYLLSHVARFEFGQLDSSYSRNLTETRGRSIPPGTPGRVPGDARTLENTNNLVDTKLVAAVGGTHVLSAGGQWWKANMVDAVAPEPYHHRQAAVFAEDEWRMIRQLALTMGLRYDNHNAFGGNLSPRAYLVYSPGGIVTLKGGVSRGFKTPQLNQLATGIVGFGRQGTMPLIGSPGLKPETSTSTEVGALFNLNRLSFGLTLFNNEFQDKIATGPGLENCSFAGSPNRPGCVDFGNWPTVDLFGQQINVDEAVTRGVEATMRFSFLSRFNLQHNYTFTQSKQLSGAAMGQPLVNTPKHMYNATLRHRTTSRLNTWLRVEARTNRTRGSSATALAVAQQLGPYKGYGLAHLGASFEVSKHILLSATVYNLFNTDFLTYQPYLYNGVTSYASDYNNLQEPRRAWVSVAYNF